MGTEQQYEVGRETAHGFEVYEEDLDKWNAIRAFQKQIAEVSDPGEIRIYPAGGPRPCRELEEIGEAGVYVTPKGKLWARTSLETVHPLEQGKDKPELRGRQRELALDGSYGPRLARYARACQVMGLTPRYVYWGVINQLGDHGSAGPPTKEVSIDQAEKNGHKVPPTS